jgi:hypothetical protein
VTHQTNHHLQKTLEEMRAEKSEKFNELKSNKNAPEYEEWFLRYRPNDIKEMREKIANTNIKTVAKKTSTKAKTKKNRKKSIMEKLGITRRK